MLLQCGVRTRLSDRRCRLVFPECWSWLQGYKPDYMYLLQRTMMDSPDAAVNLAKMIAKQPGPPIELNVIADLFLQRNMVREATAFLLDVLQDNSPEQEKLQTKVSVAILATRQPCCQAAGRLSRQDVLTKGKQEADKGTKTLGVRPFRY